MSHINWNDKAKAILLGRKIVKVEYIDKQEAKDYMWSDRGVSFVLDNGTRVITMSDDEGNDAGVLAYLNKNVDEVLPVIDLDYEKRYLNKRKRK